MKEIEKAINNWVKKNNNKVLFVAGFVSFKDVPSYRKQNTIKDKKYYAGAFDKETLGLFIEDVKEKLLKNKETIIIKKELKKIK